MIFAYTQFHHLRSKKGERRRSELSLCAKAKTEVEKEKSTNIFAAHRFANIMRWKIFTHRILFDVNGSYGRAYTDQISIKNAYYENWLLVKLYWPNDINTVQFYGPSISGKLNELKGKWRVKERRDGIGTERMKTHPSLMDVKCQHQCSAWFIKMMATSVFCECSWTLWRCFARWL